MDRKLIKLNQSTRTTGSGSNFNNTITKLFIGFFMGFELAQEGFVYYFHVYKIRFLNGSVQGGTNKRVSCGG